MRYAIFISLLSFICFAAFSGCKKEDKATTQPSQKVLLLTTGQWRLIARMNGTDDEYARLPACLKDNYTIFKLDGTSEQNEGPTKCDPSNTQISKGDWRFAENETELWLNGIPWELIELTTVVLKIHTISLNSGERIVMTFNKQ